MASSLDGCVNEVSKQGDVRFHSCRRRQRDGTWASGLLISPNLVPRIRARMTRAPSEYIRNVFPDMYTYMYRYLYVMGADTPSD